MLKLTKEATIEEVKSCVIQGEISEAYSITLEVPSGYLKVHEKGNLFSFNAENEELAEVILATTSAEVVSTGNGRSVIKLTVSPSYINVVYQDLKKLENVSLIVKDEGVFDAEE